MREILVARHRVLIVDDEESTRLLIARVLSKELRLEAQLAGTSEHALKLAGNYAYDAIVLDLRMPGIGGLAVLSQIRAGSPNAHTPVVMLAVQSQQRTIDACIAAGANAYLVKPVRRAELVATMRAQLEARSRAKVPR